MNYTVIMTHTFETYLDVEAQSEAEALVLAEAREDRFGEELDQCNSIEESYRIEGPVEEAFIPSSTTLKNVLLDIINQDGEEATDGEVLDQIVEVLKKYGPCS